MFRFSHRSRGGRVYPVLLGIFGTEEYNPSDDVGDTPTAMKLKEEMRLAQEETGWDRVKRMYTIDESGLSVEALSCVQLTGGAAVFGFAIGGVDKAKHAVAEFKDQNQAQMYRSTLEAQKSCQAYVTKQFLRGAVPMMLKTSSFLGIFSLICSTSSCYRGKTSLSDFALSGFITGALFTLNRGLAGAFTGGAVGLILGSLSGGMMIGILYASGINFQEVRMWQYEQAQKRTKLEHRKMVDVKEKVNDKNERAAFLMMKDEEREKGRILDELNEITKPAQVRLEIPLLPPESMLRKEEQ